MANLKLLEKIGGRKKPQAIPGGSKRPSLRVDLREFPKVHRRQELNRLLLANGCGNGEPINVKFRPTDLGLLVQIAEERGANANPLLRRQAITALSQFRELDAAAALARLAQSELDHQSVRISARMALEKLSPDLACCIDVQYQKASMKPAGRKKKAIVPSRDRR